MFQNAETLQKTGYTSVHFYIFHLLSFLSTLSSWTPAGIVHVKLLSPWNWSCFYSQIKFYLFLPGKKIPVTSIWSKGNFSFCSELTSFQTNSAENERLDPSLTNMDFKCRIWGFYGGDCEDCRLLGCSVLWVFYKQMFRWRYLFCPEDGGDIFIRNVGW
jgi:hypothetical protein